LKFIKIIERASVVQSLRHRFLARKLVFHQR
jgi:hypothetical protein